MTMTGQAKIESFFDKRTSSVTYLVSCPETRMAAIIDPVLDFDPRSGRTNTEGADQVLAAVAGQKLTVQWLLETHVHADHMTAAGYLKQKTGAPRAIGRHVREVQQTFVDIYNLNGAVRADGSQFDRLFEDGESFAIGRLEAKVIHLPGHTPACIAYCIGDAVFSGDAIFMPDYGSARCDFPGGDAAALYRSVRRLLELPPETRIFVGHDYGPDGRPFAWETTVAAERAANKHLKDGVDEASFVAMRRERDRQLNLPDLMLAAIQVNIRAGAMPGEEENGISYLKIPLNKF